MLAEFWQWIGGANARLLPQTASSFAIRDDKIMLYMLAISVISMLGIGIALVWFIIKYRRRPGNEIARHVEVSFLVEATWTLVPFTVVLAAFFWGAHDYIDMLTPPRNAESVFVVGKQWMWKMEHENGVSEINALHVPIGRPINLVMISQDVIHSFFAPDLRVKYDVLPGRYTRVWFKADKPGNYLLLCTQYCGTDHSRMVGAIQAMTENDYQAWLANSRKSLPVAEQAESRGERLFTSHGCASCHSPLDEKRIGPDLHDRFFSGDEDFIRNSMIKPSANVAPGFPDVMPTYSGQLEEDEIIDLIRYLESRPHAGKRKDAAND